MTKYVEDTYSKIAKVYTYALFDDVSTLPLIDILIKHLSPGEEVLDLGCGPGRFSKYLSDSGLSVIGIDILDEMLDIAKAKVPNVTFKKMDMRHIDYPDATFDGILAAFSIICIPTDEIDSVMQEIKRILKPGGHILFIAQEGKPDQILDEPLMKGEKVFINFFTKKRLAKIISKAGLVMIQQSDTSQKQIKKNLVDNLPIGTLAKRP